MHRVHHHMQDWIDELLSLFRIDSFEQSCRTFDIGKENRHLLPFSFQGLSRGQYLFGEVPGNVAVRRRCPGNSGCRDCCGLLYGLTANSAKPRFGTVQLTTMRTNRFEPHPAAVAKDSVRQIIALTLRADHNGNQSEMGCIAPDFIKPELSVHSEGSKQCIVPGYAESKLNCFSPFGLLTYVAR